jgi:hypothetical protein
VPREVRGIKRSHLARGIDGDDEHRVVGPTLHGEIDATAGRIGGEVFDRDVLLLRAESAGDHAADVRHWFLEHLLFGTDIARLDGDDAGCARFGDEQEAVRVQN